MDLVDAGDHKESIIYSVHDEAIGGGNSDPQGRVQSAQERPRDMYIYTYIYIYLLYYRFYIMEYTLWNVYWGIIPQNTHHGI